MRRPAFGLSLLLAALTVISATQDSASAHHFIDTCDEVGLFDRQDMAPYKEAASTLSSVVYVGHIPPAKDCNAGTFQGTTQHSSLHSKSKDFSKCLELVAQRSDTGHISMWGYDCRSDSNVSLHDISNYGSDIMFFWMTSGGDEHWDLWYYRYDTSQWVYLSTVVNRDVKMVPWAESTGYNASSSRNTWFNSYVAENEFGQWSPAFTCSVYRNLGPDNHQAMRVRSAGAVVFEPNPGFACG
ncbi:MAG: hypothetical protein M3N53_13170 [Actinomycetota bacterium]|nr:hypothetical protein [Actinomycetota bacterium]